MTCLLYAITTPPTAELQQPPRRLAVRNLVAWTTDVSPDRPPFTREDLLHYHAEVCSICERVEACVPARFPTVLADEDALRGALEAREGELMRQLEVVRGACELAVTAVWLAPENPAPEVEAPTPGRRYLLRRQIELMGSDRRRARAEDVASAIEHQAGDALRQARRRVLPSTRVALSHALLVERSAADTIRERLAQYAPRHVRILVHGPWPPYSFVER